MQNDFRKLKGVIIEMCTQVLQNEELKQLVEKAQNVDELFGILNNNSLTLSQKQIESYKLLVKDKIKENANYGPITKKVFKEIVDSDISPREMVQRYFEYTSINDVRN